MKKHIRAVLLAAALAAAASTQAATYNSDLILGFTSQSGNDFVYDLGAASSLTSGETWTLTSQLAGYTLGSVNWGVVGTATIGTARTAWVTVGTGLTPNTVPNTSAWGKINTADSAIFSSFTTAGAGNSATPSSADANGWNQQTINGSLATQYHNVYEIPNVTGTTSADFYSVIGNGSAPSQVGTFSLDSTGTVTFTAFTPVPEPATYGVLAGLGLLALSLRRQMTSKAV
jgi:hypothetical protein